MQPQVQTTDHVESQAVIGAWLAKARLEGEEDSYAGKRRWPRVSWRVPVTLEVDPDGRKPVICYATSRDISQGGIGVQARQRIATMSDVRITVDEDGTSVPGRVMHCTETLGGFIVGIEFVRQASARQILRKSA